MGHFYAPFLFVEIEGHEQVLQKQDPALAVHHGKKPLVEFM
jgi:hypothetical protein